VGELVDGHERKLVYFERNARKKFRFFRSIQLARAWSFE
jgi:hypothetical protein